MNTSLTDITTTTPSFFSLYSLVDKPERVLEGVRDKHQRFDPAHNMSRNISKTRDTASAILKYNVFKTYIVKRMLIRRSQLHPVMKAAAAGGKIIAT